MVGFLVSKPRDLIAAFSSPLCRGVAAYRVLAELVGSLNSTRGARINGARAVSVKEVKGFLDFINLILRGVHQFFFKHLRMLPDLNLSSVKPGLSYVSFLRGAPLKLHTAARQGSLTSFLAPVLLRLLEAPIDILARTDCSRSRTSRHGLCCRDSSQRAVCLEERPSTLPTYSAQTAAEDQRVAMCECHKAPQSSLASVVSRNLVQMHFLTRLAPLNAAAKLTGHRPSETQNQTECG